MIRMLAREARLLASNTHDLMHKDAPARLAAWLHQQAAAAPSEQQPTLALTMRKRDLASLLAITPETLSRLMRSFSNQGLIQVAGYQLRLLDLPALLRLATQQG
jgi:CRP-like cAMP-binding protein